MRIKKRCPACGAEQEEYLNPIPTVDIIIEWEGKGIILIKRRNVPRGWAIPGGFVDYGESLEEAAIREAKEETGLDVELVRQLHTYSDPSRDKRFHTISTVFIARAKGTPKAADDAEEIGIFTKDNLPEPLMFDHAKILGDYIKERHKGTEEQKHKAIRKALQESQAKYYDLYENAPDMYYSADLETGAIRECNETFLRITGYTREEVIGLPIFDLYDAGSREEQRKLFQQFPLTGELRDVERRVKCKDGRIIEVSLNVSSVRDKEGKIIYTRAIWHDITRRKKYEELIQTLAITDQLTGLYNRRGLMTLAEQQLKMAERTKESLLLLFADLDDLKQINDQFGHKTGDEVIIEIANILQEVFRKVDIISRIGGDEYAVLATEASLEYADLIRKRLQDQLALHNARAGRAFNISISVGMAYYDPEHPCSLDELITRADSLMYEEKVGKKGPS